MRLFWIDQTRGPGLAGAHRRWTDKALQLAGEWGHEVVEVPRGLGRNGSALGEARVIVHAVTDGGDLAPEAFDQLGDDNHWPATLHLGYHGFVGAPKPGQLWWAFGQAHAEYLMSRGVAAEALVMGAPPYWGPFPCDAPDPVQPHAPPVAVYASSWDRGLAPLLEIWPWIRRAVPEARLRVLYGSDGRSIPTGPGIEVVGRLTDKQVLEEFANARVMLYPDTSGAEMYCFSAREALMCGAPLLCTKMGALRQLGRNWAVAGPRQMLVPAILALTDPMVAESQNAAQVREAQAPLLDWHGEGWAWVLQRLEALL